MNATRLTTVALLTGFGLTVAVAQGIGDPQQGRAVAEAICATCHAIDAGAASSPMPAAPTFETIARTPGMSGIALNVALHTSHTKMPNLVLSAAEKRNIIAYVLGLK